jgi:FlaA1/EpsC-like NDP-sugar epimerase
MDILKIIGRTNELFSEDIFNHKREIQEMVNSSRFLIIGGAGTVGLMITKEIFSRNPQKLHVVDTSENGIVELVRDIRCSMGYIDGDFKAYAIDSGSDEYDAFIEDDGKYDYVINLAALKHVRSEKDPYTAIRMLCLNALNAYKTLKQSIDKGTRKYFCASTDKANAPANIYGASKLIMEMFLVKNSRYIDISNARFANVAFSNGSLLDCFNHRIQKLQPIAAPEDVKRYFITPKECAELSLMSILFGENLDIFFPRLRENLEPVSFTDILVRYLDELGYEPYLCQTEEEARNLAHTLIPKGKWPCLFTKTDTTGEKIIEEFHAENQAVNLKRFKNIGIIKNELAYDQGKTEFIEKRITEMKQSKKWNRLDLIDLISEIVPDFSHLEKYKFLDDKM